MTRILRGCLCRIQIVLAPGGLLPQLTNVIVLPTRHERLSCVIADVDITVSSRTCAATGGTGGSVGRGLYGIVSNAGGRIRHHSEAVAAECGEVRHASSNARKGSRHLADLDLEGGEGPGARAGPWSQ